jgi:hypothetical protein
MVSLIRGQYSRYMINEIIASLRSLTRLHAALVLAGKRLCGVAVCRGMGHREVSGTLEDITGNDPVCNSVLDSNHCNRVVAALRSDRLED